MITPLTQDDVSEMKKKERLDEKKMLQIAAENKRMSEPLKIARADVKRLKKEKSEYEQDKQVCIGFGPSAGLGR